jgi:hypothetical protein
VAEAMGVRTMATVSDVCTFCGTEVRSGFATCTGCGAMWQEVASRLSRSMFGLAGVAAVVAFGEFYVGVTRHSFTDLKWGAVCVAAAVLCGMVASWLERPRWCR